MFEESGSLLRNRGVNNHPSSEPQLLSRLPQSTHGVVGIFAAPFTVESNCCRMEHRLHMEN